jgi:hypothetical protein
MEKVSAKSHFGDAKLPFGIAEMGNVLICVATIKGKSY